MSNPAKIALTAIFCVSGLTVAYGQQQQGVRGVGISTFTGSSFHGTLGSGGLDGFRSFSSGVPSSVGLGDSSALNPANRILGASTVGGLANTYRITGSPVAEPIGPAGPAARYSSSGSSVPLGVVPTSYPSPPASTSGLFQLPALNSVLPSARLRGPLDTPLTSPAGSPGPQPDPADQSPAALGPSAAPAATAAVPAPSAPFDLAGQSKANPRWQMAVELLKKQQQYDKAAGEIRIGLVFSPGRAEGEWLLAVADVALEDYVDAVYRLRNALEVCPDLLAKSRGAADLLASALIEQRLAGTSSADGLKPSAERLLVAAWLACELGRADQAKGLLASARDLVGAARPVAVAIGQSLGGAGADSGAPGAATPTPAASSPAASSSQSGNPSAGLSAGDSEPAMPLDRWMQVAPERLMGLPPSQYHCTLSKSGR